MNLYKKLKNSLINEVVKHNLYGQKICIRYKALFYGVTISAAAEY